jgi:hypothetical protein
MPAGLNTFDRVPEIRGALVKNRISPIRAPFALALATLCGVSMAARADDIRMLGNIGDAHKSSGLITSYQINTDKRSLDLIAATPSVSSLTREQERQIAADTAREICAQGGVGGSWTVRIFLPGESTPAGSCRMGGHH